MELIQSFSVDHTAIVPGIFISREDKVGVVAAADDLASGLDGVASGEAFFEGEESGAVGRIADTELVKEGVFEVLGRGLIDGGDWAAIGNFDGAEVAVLVIIGCVFHG